MKLDWMMLANAAEAPQDSGVINMLSAGWDTVHVTAPMPEGAPPDVVAILQGHLAIRLLFHVTECDQHHSFAATFMDDDGNEIAKIEGGLTPPKIPGMPAAWDHGTHMVFPIAGLPIPDYGHYTISLQVDGNHLGDKAFRVLKEF